jgi:formylglycine-generating enzyme required for sulfatase activity
MKKFNKVKSRITAAIASFVMRNAQAVIRNSSFVIAMALAINCSDEKEPVFGVSLDVWELNLEIDDSYSLVATVAPSIADDLKVTFQSGDNAIVTVGKDGTVTAIAAGATRVTANAANGKSVSIPVTVKARKAQGVKVTPKLITVPLNSSTNLFPFTATVSPANAEDTGVKWTSSNPALATVDTVGVVTKKNIIGITTITATSTADATLYDTATFVVMNLRLLPVTLFVGDEHLADLDVQPVNAPDKDFEWVSANPSIATVDQNGNITGVSKGSAVVTVRLKSNPDVSTSTNVVVMPNQVQSITVTPLLKTVLVTSPTSDYPFTATVLPADAEDKTITWSSSNTVVATVNATGVVTKQGVTGITTITATSTVNAAISGSATFVAMSLRFTTYGQIFAGATAPRIFSFAPADAPDQDFEWSSADPSIATVNASTGTVTGVSGGTATITVRLKSTPEVSASTTVTVKGNFTESAIGADFIGVKGGTFTMGQSTDVGSVGVPADYPQHQVTLTHDFALSKTEVTQKQWKTVMGSLPAYVEGGDNFPVYMVSYSEVQTFISALNTLTGKTYRLPTEAEWEYAARGGDKTHGYTYSGSNTINNVAWYEDNTRDPLNPSFSDGKPRAVATKAANELGLFDMSGNVAEWVNDWFAPYTSAAQTDPTKGAGTVTSDCVVRNGAVGFPDTDQTVTYRAGMYPNSGTSYVGFRLAITL